MTSNRFVCVVEGDPAVRDSLETLMSLSGHDVLTFATGSEFLAAVNGRAVSCVVCEAELPDTTGLELFQAFKPQHPETRFALLLSRSDPAGAAAARRFGVDAVFEKPLMNRRLISFVKAAESA